MVRLISIILLLKLVGALRPLPADTVMRRLLNVISIAKQMDRNSRRINPETLARARTLFKTLTKGNSRSQIKKILRDAAAAEEESISPAAIEPAGRDEQAGVVEQELINTINQASSALLERPYVEKKGQNDFLVMKPDTEDSFVTIIPNSIYYNIEKKCVNWLDDCSLQGIRARLLNRVKYPYKRR